MRDGRRNRNGRVDWRIEDHSQPDFAAIGCGPFGLPGDTHRNVFEHTSRKEQQLPESTVPAWGYQLEYDVNVGKADTSEWVKATELLSWEMAGDAKTYEAAWIDHKNPPAFTYARACVINFEKDTVIGNAFDA